MVYLHIFTSLHLYILVKGLSVCLSISLFLYFSITLYCWLSYVMWTDALDSSGVLLSYSIISPASPMTCQYTDIYPLLNI